MSALPTSADDPLATRPQARFEALTLAQLDAVLTVEQRA